MTTCAKCLELGSLCVQHDAMPNPLELVKGLEAEKDKLEKRIWHLVQTFKICGLCRKEYSEPNCFACFKCLNGEWYD